MRCVFQELINVLWGLARLGHPPGLRVLQHLEGYLLKRIQYLNPVVRAGGE